MTTPTGATGKKSVGASLSRGGSAHLRPGEEGYDEASRAWNLNARQNPAVVVVAEDEGDVLSAVRLARDEGAGAGVMATGHGVGILCDGGVLVNTSRMRGVRVDSVAQKARVEAGALWADVVPEAQVHGLTGLAGSAPHVGVVGYTMGGGFGWLGRKYGFNAASVVEAEVITAEGELVRASAAEHPDLFWGLKGGGGNFGIVTSLEFRLYPLATVYGGAVFYPVEEAKEVLGAYARWTEGLPDEMTTAFAFLNVPPVPRLPEPLRGRSVVVVRGVYCGRRPEDGEELFRPVREGLGEPIMDTLGKMPVSTMDSISRDPVDPMGIVQHAEMLSELSPEAIEALVGAAGAGSGSPLLMLELRQLGGALARTQDHLNPMGGGDARFSMNAIGASRTPETEGAARAHMARLFEATRPFQTGGTFVNFLEVDPAEDRVRAAYPPEDWDLLVALKDRYDPNNLFRFNRNIPPSSTVRRG
jgi:FAD/FMN-containing dehydrogenase